MCSCLCASVSAPVSVSLLCVLVCAYLRACVHVFACRYIAVSIVASSCASIVFRTVLSLCALTGPVRMRLRETLVTPPFVFLPRRSFRQLLGLGDARTGSGVPRWGNWEKTGASLSPACYEPMRFEAGVRSLSSAKRPLDRLSIADMSPDRVETAVGGRWEK